MFSEEDRPGPDPIHCSDEVITTASPGKFEEPVQRRQAPTYVPARVRQAPRAAARTCQLPRPSMNAVT